MEPLDLEERVARLERTSARWRCIAVGAIVAATASAAFRSHPASAGAEGTTAHLPFSIVDAQDKKVLSVRSIRGTCVLALYGPNGEIGSALHAGAVGGGVEVSNPAGRVTGVLQNGPEASELDLCRQDASGNPMPLALLGVSAKGGALELRNTAGKAVFSKP